MKVLRGSVFSCGGECSNASARVMDTDVDSLLQPFPNLKGGSWLSADGTELVEYPLAREIWGRNIGSLLRLRKIVSLRCTWRLKYVL
jgi:hypothetical protein